MTNRKSAGDAATSHSAINKSVAEPLRKGYKGSIPQSEAQGKQLIELLTHGKAHAVSMAHLAAVLGCNEREVRAMIHRARCDGSIICGDSNGYYLPDSRA